MFVFLMELSTVTQSAGKKVRLFRLIPFHQIPQSVADDRAPYPVGSGHDVGLLFDANDRPDGPTVVIISEAIQERFFPGENPIGRRIRGGGPHGAEIVGVVGNIRRASLTDAPRADLYFPGEQGPPTATSRDGTRKTITPRPQGGFWGFTLRLPISTRSSATFSAA